MTNESKQPHLDVMDCIRERFSPYAFEPRSIPTETLKLCFESARWAASSYNEQPWSYLCAKRENSREFEKMISCLAEGNQEWASNAGAVVFAIVYRTMSRNGKHNRSAEHDMGFASALFNLQAVTCGLQVHHMEGINRSKIQTLYSLDESSEAITGFAIGYVSKEEERKRDQRTRKSVAEFVEIYK